MVKEYMSIVLKLCSLGLIIAAAGLWAGAGVDNRPKYRDDQVILVKHNINAQQLNT